MEIVPLCVCEWSRMGNFPQTDMLPVYLVTEGEPSLAGSGRIRV